MFDWQLYAYTIYLCVQFCGCSFCSLYGYNKVVNEFSFFFHVYAVYSQYYLNDNIHLYVNIPSVWYVYALFMNAQ